MKNRNEYEKQVMGFDQAIFTLADQWRQNLTHFADMQKMIAKMQRVRYLELLNQGFTENQALELVKGSKPFNVV